jgi:hypothetical protein
VAVSCEYVTELSYAIEDGKFVDYLCKMVASEDGLYVMEVFLGYDSF